jgi:Fe-S cluster biogenesis protein NfuA
MASVTLKLGIERVLAEEVPELAGVEAVNVDVGNWPGFEPA